MGTHLVKCIIVDDDSASLKIIEALIQKTPFLELSASFTDPIAAADYLSKEDIELIFLDMEMPGIAGLELINLLKHPPFVIVISSKKEYAFDAFALNVVDYLVKPVTEYSRFLEAALRAKENLKKVKPSVIEKEGQFFIKVDSMLHNLNLSDILWIEAFGDYIKIKTADKVMTALSTMKSIESRLPANLFVRVHRSFIVNLTKINKIDLTELHINVKIIPVSNFYREALMKKISLL